MKKNKLIVLVLTISVTMIVLIAGNSFANPVVEESKNINLTLIDNDNIDILESEIINFIELVDNNLIPNTSFNISDKLNENYDFLTDFSISFILDNSEYYGVIEGSEYKYVDEYGGEFTTNKYINIDKIYEITNQVFGVEYYYILNDYIEIENDLVPLLKLEDRNFDMEIDSIIDIDKLDDYIDVVVRYKDNSLDYVYRFEYINNRLVIGNLSIRE